MLVSIILCAYHSDSYKDVLEAVTSLLNQTYPDIEIIIVVDGNKELQEKIEEYRKHHETVWPEMLEALRRTGWHNYTLFMREDGLLFGCLETPESFQAALEGMAQEEINAKWQDFMAPYFEDLGGAHPDENMVELEEVFRLD